jgi:hypothetical protein
MMKQYGIKPSPMLSHGVDDDKAKAKKILQEEAEYSDEVIQDEAISNIKTQSEQ